MRTTQKDTYSVSFGEDRINEIRSISKATRLKQSEILAYMWDNYKIEAVQKLLADHEQDLESTLNEVKNLLEQLKADPQPAPEPAPEPEEPPVAPPDTGDYEADEDPEDFAAF